MDQPKPVPAFTRIGQRLKILRRLRGLNQSQAAKRYGLSQAQVCRLEMGLQGLRFSVLLRICRVLKTKPSELLKSVGL